MAESINPFNVKFSGLNNLLTGQEVIMPSYGQNKEGASRQQAPEDDSSDYDGLPGDIEEISAFEAGLKSGAIPKTYSNIVRFQNMVNNLKFRKSEYEKYNDAILEKGCGSDYAISKNGEVLVEVRPNVLKAININKVEKGMKVLTYDEVASYRANISGTQRNSNASNLSAEDLIEFMKIPRGRSDVYDRILEISKKAGDTLLEGSASATVGGSSASRSEDGSIQTSGSSSGNSESITTKQPGDEQFKAQGVHIWNALSRNDHNRLELEARLAGEYEPESFKMNAINNVLFGFNSYEYKNKVVDAMKDLAGIGGKKGNTGDKDDLHRIYRFTDIVDSGMGASPSKEQYGNLTLETNIGHYNIKDGVGNNMELPTLSTVLNTSAISSMTISGNNYLGDLKINNGAFSNSIVIDSKTETEKIPFNEETGDFDTQYKYKLANVYDTDFADRDSEGKKKKNVQPSSVVFTYEGKSYTKNDLDQIQEVITKGESIQPNRDDLLKGINAWFLYNKLPQPYSDGNKKSVFDKADKFDLNRYEQEAFPRKKIFFRHKVLIPETFMKDLDLTDADYYKNRYAFKKYGEASNDDKAAATQAYIAHEKEFNKLKPSMLDFSSNNISNDAVIGIVYSEVQYNDDAFKFLLQNMGTRWLEDKDDYAQTEIIAKNKAVQQHEEDQQHIKIRIQSLK